ncbi:MAG: PilZ domain-containing protein [Candidatus Omnitrophica bacterium]|nr:PilZ domain-containing protein [Candidatus Omnitrophota bacterium]
MKSDAYKGPERRTYMRLDADCAVSYIKLSADLRPAGDIVEDAYSKDISGAGIKFITAERIPEGTFLEVHIKIPTAGKVITAVGKVMRCESERKKFFRTAISFVWIAKNDKAAIDEYVKKIKLDMLRSETKM